ncbi:MAG: hypothetical protein H7Y12_06520 [Sphingobacteriaceae bacterium]|nr:hypothetical protein [Cytophagaceae bacterium]
MSALWRLIYRCLVVEFYQRNIGLLLVVLLLAGGFLSSVEHIALARYAMQLPLVLGVYGALWALYALKTVQFVRQTLHDPAFEILFFLRLVPARTRWLVLAGAQVALLGPVLGYAVFVMAYGYAPGAEWALATVPGFLILLLLAAVNRYDAWLKNPHADQRRRSLSAWVTRRWQQPYPLFFIQHVLRAEPVLLVLTKLGAGFVLWGVCRLYPTDDYDGRLISLGVLLAAAMQGPILVAWKTFEDQKLLFLRNLPFSLSQRAGFYLLTAALLWLPETLLLLRYRPDGVSWGFQLGVAVFGLSLNALFFSSLFGKNRSLEELMPRLFWGVIVGFFLIMFRVPVEGLAIGCLTSAFLIFRKTFLTG